MCINCLKIQMEEIEEYENDVNNYLEGIVCECCKSFPTFLLGVNTDLKILCLTKMKRYNNGKKNLIKFEKMIKNQIKYKMDKIVEQIFEMKEELDDKTYLTKMTQVKNMNDKVKQLDDADHR